MLINNKDTENELNLLIRDCVNQNRQSQSRLYEIFAPKMFVLCLRYSRSREEAEETLQEGFMKVFECVRQFKFAGSFEGWIRKIMVNCALQKFRSKPALRAIISIDIAPVDYPGSEDILPGLEAKELIKLVQQLPPVYRMIFNLFVFEGMKHREIAGLLGISEGTSKSNLSDARAILQKMITRSSTIAGRNINCL